MLTSYQLETGAYVTQDGEILCDDCFELGNEYARPMSNYELDEYQTWESSSFFDDNGEEGHVEGCSCVFPVTCVECLTELREAYTDYACAEKQKAGEDA